MISAISSSFGAYFIDLISRAERTLLILEQHRFELHGSTYMQVFSNKYIGNIFGAFKQFEKNHK